MQPRVEKDVDEKTFDLLDLADADWLPAFGFKNYDGEVTRHGWLFEMGENQVVR